MSAVLSEFILARVAEAILGLRRAIRRRRLLIIETAGCGALLAAVVLGDYFLSLSVFWEFFGPVPGDDSGGATVAVMALSSLVAMSAYAIYRKDNPASPICRLVDRCAGAVAVTFCVGIGVMTARYIYGAVGDALSASGAALFGTENVAAGLSFLDRFFNLGASLFGLCVGAITLAQLYLVDRVTNIVRDNVWEIERLRWLALDSENWIRTLEDAPRARDALLAERDACLRALEPSVAVAFANQLLACVHQALAPINAWIGRHDGLLLKEQGGLSPPESVSVDMAALKKRVAAIEALSVKTILAAFRCDEKGKS